MLLSPSGPGPPPHFDGRGPSPEPFCAVFWVIVVVIVIIIVILIGILIVLIMVLSIILDFLKFKAGVPLSWFQGLKNVRF